MRACGWISSCRFCCYVTTRRPGWAVAVGSTPRTGDRSDRLGPQGCRHGRAGRTNHDSLAHSTTALADATARAPGAARAPRGAARAPGGAARAPGAATGPSGALGDRGAAAAVPARGATPGGPVARPPAASAAVAVAAVVAVVVAAAAAAQRRGDQPDGDQHDHGDDERVHPFTMPVTRRHAQPSDGADVPIARRWRPSGLGAPVGATLAAPVGAT